MESFNVNVLGAPPTGEQLAEAAAEVDRQWVYHSTRGWGTVGAGAALGIAGMLALAFITSGWLNLAVAMVAGLSGFGLIAYGRDLHLESTPPLEPGVFGPIGPFHAERVLNAIEVDPRLDAYRLAVVAQGRDMTVLEAAAFAKWADGDFERTQVMAAVRGTKPVVQSQAPASSAMVIPITGREPETERP